MPVEYTEELTRFTFDGPLSVTQGIVVGCVLAALAYLTLFRVPKGAPKRFSWLLWFLRAGAIAILIWMLLGPVNVTVYKHHIPKSLAIMSDVSESMGVFDPPENKAGVHWRAAGKDEPASQLLTVCDRAAVAATTAHDTLDRLLRNDGKSQSAQEGRSQLESAGRAASEATKLAEEICGLLGSAANNLGAEFLSRAREISTSLAAAKFGDISAVARNAKGDALVLDVEERGQLESCRKQLSHSARALAGFADRVAGKLSGTGNATAGGTSTPQKTLSRGEHVERLLDSGAKTWLAKYDTTARIHHYTFDREATSTADQAKDEAAADGKKQSQSKTGKEKKARSPFTNVSAALERIGRDAGPEHIEAVLMFTDGRHNDPTARDPRDVAKEIGSVPFHVIPVGTSEMQRDLVLHHVDTPTAVVEGDQIVVEAIVSAFSCAGEKAMLELTEGKNVVDRQEIKIASVRRDYAIRFAVPGKGIGRHEYSLTVAPVAGEIAPTNNAQTFAVEVVDAKLRILVADDFPRWEYRYLVNLFERSERIEYEQMLVHPSQRTSGQLAESNTLPRDVDGWARYRVAIIGDLPPDHFDEECQKSLKDFVSLRGGTVIVIAGAQSMPQAFVGMPLADLIPVTAGELNDPSQGFQLELSPEGKLTSALDLADEPGKSEQIWKDVSRQLPVYSLSQYCVPKPTARTLIRALPSGGNSDDRTNQKAFLCWQTVGRGRVVYVSAPTVYQLRMKYGDRYHHRFWGQLIRWSVARDLSQGSKTVKLAVDRSRVAVGDSLQVVATLNTTDGQPVLDAKVRADAKMNGTSTALVELKPDANIPGRYTGEFSPKSDGALTLAADGVDVTQLLQAEGYSQSVETSVVVDPTPSFETEDTRTNTPLLRQIASLTGGQVVPPTAVDEIVALMDLAPRVEEQTIRGPLWNQWIYLWLISGLLTIEWAVRKTTGRP